MEWGGKRLSEDVCVNVLTQLEPRALAAFSRVSAAARRLAASDEVWQPLFEGTGDAAAAKKRGKGRRPPASVGVWKERYRKRRVGALKDSLWRLRMKLASAEQRHGQAEESCGEIQRGLHRLRGAVATEQQAKRQRLAHGGWHPAAVQRGLATPLRPLRPGEGGRSAAEQMLQKLERQAEQQQRRRARLWERLQRRQTEVEVAQLRWQRSCQPPLLSYSHHRTTS